jgi:hypothetical protein
MRQPATMTRMAVFLGRTYVADRLGATRGPTAAWYRVGADESLHYNGGWPVSVADPAVDLRNFRSECDLGIAAPASSTMSEAEAAGILRGRVERVQFYEAHVGQPNKSVVYLSNGSGVPRMIVLEGDLRNRLPAGKRVEISYREENGRRQLLSADYA